MFFLAILARGTAVKLEEASRGLFCTKCCLVQEVHHALRKNSFPVTTSKESMSGWGRAISPSNVGIDLNLAHDLPL